MSDMSLPPLPLVPLAQDGGASFLSASAAPSAAARPASEAFAWPTPPTPGYPAPVCQTEPEPCELEGLNGKLSRGWLHFFDAQAGLIHLQIPPSRGTLSLKLSQFRRLTLSRPLPALTPPGGAAFDATTPMLPQRTVNTYTLRFKDGQVAAVDSIGQVDSPLGVFTFTPTDDVGSVLRSFYPRGVLAANPLGPRIGELLVAQQATSPVRVEAAAAEQQQLRARKLGDILLTQQIVTPAQLLAAIEQQARMPMVRIGQTLLALGYLSEAKLAAALQLQSRDRSLPLGELLVRRGDVTRADLQTALSRKMGYPIVDVDAFPVEAEAVLRLPLAAARRLLALPLMMRGGRLVVALEDPSREPFPET